MGDKRESDRLKTKGRLDSTSEGTSSGSVATSIAAEMAKFGSKVENRLSSMDRDVKSKLLSISDDVESKINSVSSSFKQLLEDLENRLTEVISSAISDLKSDITGVQSNLNDLDMRMDDFERQHKLNDVVISGVPVLKGENLQTLFSSLCSSLELKTAFSSVYIFRLRPKGNIDYSPIIVKFSNPGDKMMFITAVRRCVKQRQANIDANNPKRVNLLSLADSGYTEKRHKAGSLFVNESLSKGNYVLWKKALDLRRGKKIDAVFTSPGRVYVRLTADGNPLLISSLLDFEKLAD